MKIFYLLIFSISETIMKSPKIKEFIENRIAEVDDELSQETNPMQALRLSTMRVSFANVNK